MKEVNWDTTKKDSELIASITERAINELGLPKTRTLNIRMDITAEHLNGCKLKLKMLLEASRADFVHDVAGISQHISRKTGELRNGFLPRCAA